MNTEKKVRQIMTDRVIVANLNNSLEQVMDFFIISGIQHLPVTSDDQLEGIISIKDVFRFLHKQLMQDPKKTAESLERDFNVSKVMTANPVIISPDVSINQALEKLSSGRFSALPVCENGKIVGIVTNKDLVRVISHERN